MARQFASDVRSDVRPNSNTIFLHINIEIKRKKDKILH